MLPLGLALGSMALLMISQLTGGGWAGQIRPVLESAARTIPFLLLLAVPILAGASFLYPWAGLQEQFGSRPMIGKTDGHADSVADEKGLDEKRNGERFNKVLANKAVWLSYPFWLARAVAYFAVWTLLIYRLVGGIRKQGAFPTLRQVRGLRALSGAGLGLYGLTLTLAVIDWTMSLEPEWFSTIYAVMIAMGQILASLAFAVILITLPAFSKSTKADDLPPTAPLHDLGNLLFAFTLLWAYMSFSQYLLTYSGNLPEEIVWYLRRLKGNWQWLALALVFFQFSVPFFVLLSKQAKENPRVLFWVASLILLMRSIDLYWVIAPGFAAHPRPGDDNFAWLLPVIQPFASVGVAGLWFVIFLRNLQQAPPAILFQEEPIEEPAHAG